MFDHSPADDEQADANRLTRQTVLEALTKDHARGDVNLLRYLLRQETALHKESWGYDDNLGLAALLLAGHGDVGDVWSIWRAKGANFDTGIGLDVELLLGAGVEPTVAYVRAAEHPDREDVLRCLGDDMPSEEDVAAKLESLREYHGVEGP